MKLKFEVSFPPKTAAEQGGRVTTENEFMNGLGADWVQVLKTIRDTSTFRELKSDRELEAVTKAMLARHRMRIQSAKLRVERELKEPAKIPSLS